jgi:hypothetical protein
MHLLLRRSRVGSIVRVPGHLVDRDPRLSVGLAVRVPGHLVGRDPRLRVLMLRTFDFAVKGAANKSAQVIALGGVGIAVGVTRRTRGARRGSPDPAGLPDRQVSRAHRRPRFQRSSCLLSLRQNEGDLSVKHLGGVRRPAPSAGAFQNGVQ